METITGLLSKCSIFRKFQVQEVYFTIIFKYIQLRDFIKDFLDLKFVDCNKLILKPKKKSFAWYFILTGTIYKLPDTQNMQYLLKKILIKKQEVDVSKYLEKLDTDDPNEINSVEILKSGDFFGGLFYEIKNLQQSHSQIKIKTALIIM